MISRPPSKECRTEGLNCVVPPVLSIVVTFRVLNELVLVSTSVNVSVYPGRMVPVPVRFPLASKVAIACEVERVRCCVTCESCIQL